MDKIIEHFITMQKQSEKSLGIPGNAREELSEWHRGLYSGERQAYGHCIEYLRRHLSEQSTRPDKAGPHDDYAKNVLMKMKLGDTSGG